MMDWMIFTRPLHFATLRNRLPQRQLIHDKLARLKYRFLPRQLSQLFAAGLKRVLSREAIKEGRKNREGNVVNRM